MCLHYHDAVKHINDIRKQKKILKEYRSHLQRAKGHEVMYDTMDPKAVDNQITAANKALEDAEDKIREINESGIDKISDLDLSLLLRDLGHPASLVSIHARSLCFFFLCVYERHIGRNGGFCALIYTCSHSLWFLIPNRLLFVI